MPTDMKPNFVAEQGSGVDFLSIHCLKVLVHKIQFCYMIYIVVCEQQLSYMDINVAVLLHFLMMTLTCTFSMQVTPKVFWEMSPI